MKIIEQELLELKKRLSNVFKDPTKNDILKTFILNGSKYIRSIIAILYLKMQEIEITDEVYEVLIVGELLHNASLLHDDVIDNADLRRGKTTISKEYSSKVSILSGDYLLSVAIRCLFELDNKKVMELFNNCSQAMIEAEFKQFFLREKMPTMDEYLDICKGKTATLFSVILKSVALISGLSCEDAEIFGEKFGLSFQIKNDLEKDSAENDFKNNVLTSKDIIGIEKTVSLLDNYRQELLSNLSLYSNNIYKEEIESLVKLLCSIEKNLKQD